MSEGNEGSIGERSADQENEGSADPGTDTDREETEEAEGELTCDQCGEPVDINDDRCDECGSVQLTSMSNIRKYGVLGAVGLVMTYVFGVVVVRAGIPGDLLSLLLQLLMLGIALIGPLLIVVAALGYKRRKEIVS